MVEENKILVFAKCFSFLVRILSILARILMIVLDYGSLFVV